jgi:hypothetical protein
VPSVTEVSGEFCVPLLKGTAYLYLHIIPDVPLLCDYTSWPVFNHLAHPHSPSLTLNSTLNSPSHSPSPGECPFRRWRVAHPPACILCQTHSAARPSCATPRAVVWQARLRPKTFSIYGAPPALTLDSPSEAPFFPHDRSDRCRPLIYPSSSRLTTRLILPRPLPPHDESTSHGGRAALRSRSQGLQERVL